jgi:DNA-binding NarL/FixJ family response regulator
VHTLARAGYRTCEVRSGAEAISEATRERPRAALLDVNLPLVNGYEVCRALKDRYDLPVIFVSGYRTEPLDRVAGLLVGADDYILKPFDPDELLARVRRLVPPPSESGLAGSLDGLTPREHEVLQSLVDGQTPAEIARELVIARKTVATHVQRILGKLGVHSRSQAITLAVRAGVRPRGRA